MEIYQLLIYLPTDAICSLVFVLIPCLDFSNFGDFGIVWDSNSNLGTISRGPTDENFPLLVLLLLLLDVVNFPAPVFGDVLDFNSNLGTIFRGPTDAICSLVFLLIPRLDFSTCPPPVCGESLRLEFDPKFFLSIRWI